MKQIIIWNTALARMKNIEHEEQMVYLEIHVLGMEDWDSFWLNQIVQKKKKNLNTGKMLDEHRKSTVVSF